ncbi:galactosylgalactosylxylosylprotein 3-beta-glucuronosyltransferase P isoform X2 [Cryptotermes secundus]|uniref:galactosylgalactosylxylosylprotein 3-beta-glucuronosyltransferase P isoform X2 n=1 Tax=Cryptotermes secundus TaxID=105785 RepID=UPI000CD7DCF3|nr:galactosylgalactosylxylosylprotein 3-beta-glucuronosyltransferase P isoform X2 [Cryptotermes secundus]
MRVCCWRSEHNYIAVQTRSPITNTSVFSKKGTWTSVCGRTQLFFSSQSSAAVKGNTCIKVQLWVQAMKHSKKMWLIMLLGVCVVIIQYHISSTWLVGGSNSGTGNGLSYADPAVAAAVREELLHAAIGRLRLDDTISVSIGQKLLHDLIMQLGHELLAVGACGEVSVPAAADSSLSQVPLTSYTAPRLYIITPTYRRPEQIPELTRMAQTLMHVQNLHWLVIEDAENKTQLVSELLHRTGISHDHLVAPMPEAFKKRKGPKPRGVSNRNRGLEWLRANAKDGVFYFADDDNTYDIQLFEEIRTTKHVSMWPVGLCTKFGLSSPVVVNGTFMGFYDGWVAGRKFPVDMAGFAVSVQFLLQRPNATMPYKPGFEEDGFLKSLAPFEPKEIELKAKNCTEVLVWHTQSKKNEASAALDLTKYNNTNLVILKQLIV